MVEKRGKGVIRSLGLGLLLAMLVLAPSGQSSASMLVQKGDASLDLTKVTVTPTGVTFTEFSTSYDNPTSKDFLLPGDGYSKATAESDASHLFASAEAGAQSGLTTGLYFGSALATKMVNFTATGAGDYKMARRQTHRPRRG